MRTGKGKYVYFEKQDNYEGDFLDNAKHGIGKYFYKEKGEYFGHFENGKRHGEGVFTYLNKDSYKGFFCKGVKQGHGVYLFCDSGIQLEGEWTNGSLAQGSWKLPDGSYYEGVFENNKPSGDGRWVFRNEGKEGNVLDGCFVQRKIENEENPDEKPAIKLDWKSHMGLHASAVMVNAHEKF